MNRIHLLPEPVANQIAAGEVIERPASVVKELVENSLDAGARKVSVEIQAGGRGLIRVTDDGTGMSRDDALLCFERHATSKIQRAEDLAAIATLGFRGEALPSIASVSRLTLTTRERDGGSPEGTQVVVNGGKIADVKAAGSATGTSVEARQLFFNLPARRKFLRSEGTEAAHIQHYLTLAALAFPEVGFTFQKDGRIVWQLPARRWDATAASRLAALRERLRILLGDEKLLPVDFSAVLDEQNAAAAESDIFENALPDKPAEAPSPVTRHSSLKIWGFIGAPGESRATRESQHLFVNRRPVENRGLNRALLEGYHTSLMKGRYPVCCLFLEIDPAAVDVNVHPTKREVKFHCEPEIRKFAAQAVRDALLAFHGGEASETKRWGERLPGQSLGATTGPREPRVQPAPELPGTSGALPPGPVTPALPQFPEKLRPAPTEPLKVPTPQAPLKMGFLPRRIAQARGEPGAPVPATPTSGRLDAPSSIRHPPASPETTPQLPTPLLNVPLRLVGVIGKLYVLLESDRGLVLLDQHAAHERILYEQMLNRLEQSGSAPSQKLLLPETIELPVRDADFLREQLPVLTRLGVGLSEFGERTFLLDTLPPFVKVADPRRFALDLVDELKAAGREVNLARLGEQTIAKTVCRHAVKANDPLAGQELENLIADLRRCAMPYTCPHGRPTLIEMNYRELEKKFGRTQ